WAREVIYLRPNHIVVYDRSTEGSSSDDQFLAFHFPANPVAGSAPSGSKRFDVTYKGVHAGAMTTVLPVNAATTSIGMYPENDGQSGSESVKVWQLQIHPTDIATSQHWLTVFDTSSSASAVAAASKLNVTGGAATGTLLTTGKSNMAVVLNSGAPGTTMTG